LDFGTHEAGPLSYTPKYDDSYLRPYDLDYIRHVMMPGPDYKLVGRIGVLVQNFGWAQWLLGGAIVQNAIGALYQVFLQGQEAFEGQIPVYRLRPSEQIPVASRQGELFAKPVLELWAHMPRDEVIWGPRTVPVPTRSLPPATSATLVPQTPPPSAGPAGNTETPQIPANTNEPAVSVAPDPFADMVPITKEPSQPPANSNEAAGDPASEPTKLARPKF
jgi:hypothetical protein